MARKTASILVVEDEDSVSLVVRLVLEREGYQVISAKTGPAALQILAQERTRPHLLLTDIVLPNGMTGPELAKQLQAVDPDLKVIFSTGYCPEAVAKDVLLEEGKNLIQKPFEPWSLLEIVRDALGEY